MACSAGDDVRGGRRVVPLGGISHVVGGGEDELRVVGMPEHGEINAILIEDRFEGGLAGRAREPVGHIPRSVTGGNDPWGLETVHTGQILMQEIDLLIRITAKRTIRIVLAAAQLIRPSEADS